MLLLDEDTEVLMLMSNSLKQDIHTYIHIIHTRTGYLGLMLLLDENTVVLMLAINSLKQHIHTYIYTHATGYLGLMLLLDEDTEVLMLVTNSLKQDMGHTNQFVVGQALCAIGDIGSPDICRGVYARICHYCYNMYIYIYIYIHARACVHTHTHTHVHRSCRQNRQAHFHGQKLHLIYLCVCV